MNDEYVTIKLRKPRPGELWTNQVNGFHARVIEFDDKRFLVYYRWESGQRDSIDRCARLEDFCKQFGRDES